MSHLPRPLKHQHPLSKAATLWLERLLGVPLGDSSVKDCQDRIVQWVPKVYDYRFTPYRGYTAATGALVGTGRCQLRRNQVARALTTRQEEHLRSAQQGRVHNPCSPT